MNEFYFKECSSQYVVNVKKAIKQFRNNTSVVDNYNNLLKDTETAISNIEQCINTEEELVQRYNKMKEGNVSFLDDVIGTNPRGNNDSHYRAYLALDEKNVVEIRVATHYATKKAVSDKSNNKSQFLLQVILATPEPTPQKGEPIDNTRNVGNLRVITQQRLSSQSSIEDLCNSLKEIRDFLMTPDYSYEQSLLSQNQNNQEDKNINCNRNMNKKLIRLTEADLHRIVRESVDNILNELNWKTYMNAARKRAEQRKGDKAQELSAYANRQFKNQYFGDNYYNDIHYPNEYNDDHETQQNTLLANVNTDNGTMRDVRYGTWENPGSGTMIHNFGKGNPNGYSSEQNIEKGSNLGTVSSEYQKRIKRIGNDMNAYYNGGAKYIDGKGWNV